MDIYTNTFNILLLISSLWIVINTQTFNNNILTPQNRNKLLSDYTYYFQIHRYNFQFDFDNNNNNIISNKYAISIDNININILFHMNTSSYIFNINNNISLNYDYDGDWNEVQTLVLTSPSQHHVITHDYDNMDQYMDDDDYEQEYFDENDEFIDEYEDDPDINDIFYDNVLNMISPIHKSGKFIGIKHSHSYYNAQRVCYHKYNGQLAYTNENNNSQLYELCKILSNDTTTNTCWIASNQYNNTCTQIIHNKISNDNKCSVSNPFICEIDTIPTTQTDTFVAIGIALDWDKANEYCHTRFDTELATILSLQDNINVNNICNSVSNGESCWIGLERPFDKWQDRNAMSYNNWNTNEPNNYANDESCTEIIYNNGQWNDLPCRKSKYFICNYIGKDELKPQQHDISIDITTGQRRRLRSSATIPIYRYWQGHTHDHFYTKSAREIGTTRSGRTGRHGYKSEGIGFYLAQRRHSGMVPLYRYWKSGIGDHFYTTNTHEIGTTKVGRRGKHGYTAEGILGYCYPRRKSGTIPLYRYWKGGRRGDHFYTTNTHEIGTTKVGRRGKHGYTAEGILGYCYPRRKSGTIPLYRYWKGGRRGDHFYTTKSREIGTTRSGTTGRHGYRSEGTTCYVWNRPTNTRSTSNYRHYTWKGCYKDTGRRAMRYGPHRWKYSVDKCYRACKRSGYKYFALQAGSWCSCENSWRHATKYGRGGGCPSSHRGAGWRNDVFQIKRARSRGRKYGYIAKEASGKTTRLSCRRGYKIRVLTASYGANCKDKNRNNQRSRLRRACNNKRSCKYRVNHRKVGDPARGCAKDYTYQYQCKRSKRRRRRRKRKARRPTRRRKKRKRKRRKKKRKRYKWKCSKITRSDHEQKICIRR
eukprot:352158_1